MLIDFIYKSFYWISDECVIITNAAVSKVVVDFNHSIQCHFSLVPNNDYLVV